jgi:glyceraldehyde-3-phosphate dehydrogenase (ferredoxin)
MKAVQINSRWRRVTVKDTDEIGPVDFAMNKHFEKKSYENPSLSSKNPLCFGVGPLAGTVLPGAHRLIFIARSPIIGNLIIATMGGAGVALYHAGIDYVSLEGKGKEYTVVALKRKKKKLHKRFITISKEKLDDIYFRTYKGYAGMYGLQQYLLDELGDWYGNDYFRIITTGPAAFVTKYGSIGSTVVEDRSLKWGQDDYAARGGLGSVMVQAHNIPAIVFGGDFKEKRFENGLDIEKANEFYMKEFGKKAAEVWTSTTKKYRYDDALGTGGTFGVNFSSLEEKFLFFNWGSTYLPPKQRKTIYDKLIKGWYWRKFQDEVIKTRSWRTCGEQCPVVCKKVNVIFKKDYEPYAANGPQLGIFNMEDAERIVRKVDEMGFDAIEIGNILAWIMEARAKNILSANDIGTDIPVQFDAEEYMKSPLLYSHSNMLVANHLLNLIITGDGIGGVLRKNIRQAANELERKHKGIKDLALYTPYGKDCAITPIMYWTPGVFAPLPMLILSKIYYAMDKFDPYEIGKASAERTIEETSIDQFGFCRFHRGWTTKVDEQMIAYVTGRAINSREMSRGIVRKLIEYSKRAGVTPVFWETRRVKDVVANFVEDFSKMTENKELKNWVAKFGNSFDTNMKRYWKEMLRGIEEGLL